jgi:hypothetical protein
MILAHAVPPFAARGLSGNTDEETISLQAEVHLGHMPWALTKRRRRRKPVW